MINQCDKCGGRGRTEKGICSCEAEKILKNRIPSYLLDQEYKSYISKVVNLTHDSNKMLNLLFITQKSKYRGFLKAYLVYNILKDINYPFSFEITTGKEIVDAFLNENVLIEKYKDVDLLVLEIGNDIPNKLLPDLFRNIVEDRLDKGKNTWVYCHKNRFEKQSLTPIYGKDFMELTTSSVFGRVQ